jgi:transcriptional regulator with XRE-family HTH domain
MHFIADNLKFLRKSHNWTQGDFAHHLGVKRSLIGAYEEGRADPRISFLQLICDKFGLKLDQLINGLLDENTSSSKKDLSGKSIRVLPIALDSQTNRELAIIVPIKAAAGYLNGYGDVEYIEHLPAFSLPFPELPTGRTYRLFQIQGDSMNPVRSGSYVICSYEMDWKSIKNDACYVIVSRSEGIVFKRVLNNIEQGYLTLKSDNPNYKTYNLDLEDLVEVWRAEGFTEIGIRSNHNQVRDEALLQELNEVKEQLSNIEDKLTR